MISITKTSSKHHYQQNNIPKNLRPLNHHIISFPIPMTVVFRLFSIARISIPTIIIFHSICSLLSIQKQFVQCFNRHKTFRITQLSLPRVSTSHMSRYVPQESGYQHVRFKVLILHYGMEYSKLHQKSAKLPLTIHIHIFTQ
jgi:hypothetical protein